MKLTEVMCDDCGTRVQVDADGTRSALDEQVMRQSGFQRGAGDTGICAACQQRRLRERARESELPIHWYCRCGACLQEQEMRWSWRVSSKSQATIEAAKAQVRASRRKAVLETLTPEQRAILAPRRVR